MRFADHQKEVFRFANFGWLAGLLEGEGSFMKGPPSSPNNPRISIQMTDEDVIARVAHIFGVRYVSSRRYKKNKNWKPSFGVILRGKKAVQMMKDLEYWMGDRRREQIRRALASHDPQLHIRKLTAENVFAIRAALSRGTKRTFLAKKYGVSVRMIYRIQAGEVWKEVYIPPVL